MLTSIRRWWRGLWWGAYLPAERLTIQKVSWPAMPMSSLCSVAYDDSQGLWVAVGDDGVDPHILTSPEGVTWTEQR